jgi:uncharacterized protein YecT (DUF1311 family)
MKLFADCCIVVNNALQKEEFLTSLHPQEEPQMHRCLNTALLTACAAVIAFGVMTFENDGASAQSFNCANASTKVERMICNDPRLAELDSELAEAYKIALRDSPWASANRRIRADQQKWIARRDRCDTDRCVRKLYQMRLGQLHAEVDVEADADDGGGAMAGSGGNASQGRMMAICRDRAAHVLHVRAGDVETKYEGQRTDGTHAVNGTAYLRGIEETFQCSFNASGSQVVRFIVN